MAAHSRPVGALILCVGVGCLVLGPLPRVPGLTVVALGFSAIGHLVGAVVGGAVGSPLVAAVAGVAAPLVVPLALALRFLARRFEQRAGALCLVWAAATLTALAADAQGARAAGVAAVGPLHDWSVLLGPSGIAALGSGADVAMALRVGALALVAVAVAVCAVPLVKEVVAATDRPPAAGPAWSGPISRRL